MQQQQQQLKTSVWSLSVPAKDSDPMGPNGKKNNNSEWVFPLSKALQINTIIICLESALMGEQEWNSALQSD